MTKVSIIIPILNEAERISNLLHYLLKTSSQQNIAEIIVVDGGSTDDSQNSILAFVSGRTQSRLSNLSAALEETEVILLNSKKGRANQMNFGAKHASGNIFYFLHADSLPPKDFDKFIIDNVKEGHLAGCFKMEFDSNHWWLKFTSWFTKFSWPICRGGDQSLFITRSLFEDMGGYDENYIIYEDNILTKNLYHLKQFKVIQKAIKTSSRLYKKHGVWKVQYHFFVIHLKHVFGKNPNELYAYYKKHIS